MYKSGLYQKSIKYFDSANWNTQKYDKTFRSLCIQKIIWVFLLFNHIFLNTEPTHWFQKMTTKYWYENSRDHTNAEIYPPTTAAMFCDSESALNSESCGLTHE